MSLILSELYIDENKLFWHITDHNFYTPATLLATAVIRVILLSNQFAILIAAKYLAA